MEALPKSCETTLKPGVDPQQRPESQAYVAVNSATMVENIPSIVTSIMNLLLRSLGHAVLWAEFEDDVRVIADGMRQ